MMKKVSLLLCLMSVMFYITSCFETVPGLTDSHEGLTRVELKVSQFSQIPFDTRSSVSLSDAASRLDVAVFSSDGTRVEKKNQKLGDPDFGSPVFYLVPGTYSLACIAHNGNGVATLTSPNEVSFSNNKITDTFYHYDDVFEVGEVSQTSQIILTRPVAMVRFVFTDVEFPADFTQMEFYYTGGSSTFSPLLGFGSKESRQTEVRSLADCRIDDEGNHVFELYTFPHTQNDVLKIKVTPQTSMGEDLTPFIREFTEVAVTINKISEYRGIFFTSGSSSTSSSLELTVQDEWGGTSTTTF